jgi:2-polyprenyl-3-methyl-5-hydroxy-6-metoxy-1,4-benzoquinol methylase
MTLFQYGRVYHKLSTQQIQKLKIVGNSDKKLLFLSKLYFYLFGYPDIAGQKRYIVVEKLLKLRDGERVLDAGSGNGIYLQEFGDKYRIKGVGVDARKDRIDKAEKINKYLGENNIFISSTLEKINLGTKKFDKIICLEVLEHIVGDKQVLKKLSKILVGSGLLIFSVPIKGTGLTKAQIDNPNFKPRKYEHVRSGYTDIELKEMALYADLKVLSIQKDLFLVSRYAIKFQQFLYNKGQTLLNLILSPLLLAICEIDKLINIYPRGYIVVLKKS